MEDVKQHITEPQLAKRASLLSATVTVSELRAARRFAVGLLDDEAFKTRVLDAGGTFQCVQHTPAEAYRLPRSPGGGGELSASSSASLMVVSTPQTPMTAQAPRVAAAFSQVAAQCVSDFSSPQCADYSRLPESCGVSSEQVQPGQLATPELDDVEPGRGCLSPLDGKAQPTSGQSPGQQLSGPVVVQDAPITGSQGMRESRDGGGSHHEQPADDVDTRYFDNAAAVQQISQRLYTLFELNAVPRELTRVQRAYLVRVFNYGHETFTDEVHNTISHTIMAVMSVPAALWLVVRTWYTHDDYMAASADGVSRLSRVLAATAYGMSIVLCFCASALHHGIGLRAADWRLYKLFRRIDHMGVLMLVLGSFMPPCFAVKRSPALITIGTSVAGLSLAVCALEWGTLYHPEVVPPELFLCFQAGIPLLGSVALFGLTDYSNFSGVVTCFALGGLMYLLGAYFYAAHIPPTVPGKWAGHETFHILICAGAILHFIAVSGTLQMVHTD